MARPMTNATSMARAIKMANQKALSLRNEPTVLMPTPVSTAAKMNGSRQGRQIASGAANQNRPRFPFDSSMALLPDVLRGPIRACLVGYHAAEVHGVGVVGQELLGQR